MPNQRASISSQLWYNHQRIEVNAVNLEISQSDGVALILGEARASSHTKYCRYLYTHDIYNLHIGQEDKIMFGALDSSFGRYIEKRVAWIKKQA